MFHYYDFVWKKIFLTCLGVCKDMYRYLPTWSLIHTIYFKLFFFIHLSNMHHLIFLLFHGLINGFNCIIRTSILRMLAWERTLLLLHLSRAYGVLFRSNIGSNFGKALFSTTMKEDTRSQLPGRP